MKTVVIAVLDKAWPPGHSFVDGMLATEAAKEPGVIVRLCVSRGSLRETAPRRYKRAACMPMLFPRRMIGRLLNFVVVVRLIAYQARRERGRGRRVTIFVRNDPICLLAATVLRRRVSRLVFQSSFPHEKYSGSAIMRWVARRIYRLANSGVDVVTAVTPEGVARTGRLFPRAERGPYIPLLSDLPARAPSPTDLRVGRNGEPTTFLYVGTHRLGRELDVVLAAITKALSMGASAKFSFVGGSIDDEKRLRTHPDVDALVHSRLVTFGRPVPRDQLYEVLARADVGLSLRRPMAVSYEASPTKLAEYMGAGLAVLATRGIPMQERFVEESNSGLLVNWNVEEMASAIVKMANDPHALSEYKTRALVFAKHALSYSSQLPQFRELIGHRS